MSTTDEERDDNSRAVNRNTGAFDRLNSAIDGLGGVIGAFVRGAPSQMAPLFDNDLIPGMKQFSQAMSFAEGYIGVWQGLTRSGVHFNNEIDEMIISVGQANMRLDDFVKLVGENGRELAGMGGTAQSGVNMFLSAQQKFMDSQNGAFNEQRVELERLGYTAQTLGETFMNFDALATIQGIRGRMNDRERNLAAADYAKSLDELARLTGKQVDALAEEQAEISRQGNVFAFGQMLNDNVRDELDTGLLALKQVAPSVKDFAVDILTRGFPNMDDPEMRALNAAAPGLRAALQDARQAFLDGDETRARMLMDAALGEATQLRNNNFLLRQAMLGSATEISQGSMNIMTELSNGMALNADAIAQKANEMFPEASGRFTSEQYAAALNAIIEEERRSQTAGRSDSQRTLDNYLAGIRQVQEVAMNAQEATVRGIFTMVTAAADRFIEYINAQTGRDSLLQQLLNGIEGPIGDYARNFAETGSAVMAALSASQNTINQASLVITRLDELGQTADKENLQNIVRTLSEKMSQLSTDTNNATLRNEVVQLQSALQQAITASGVTAPNTGLSPEQLEAFREAMRGTNPERNFGSLGTVGRLFEDFGRRTTVDLHGIEAVVTPDQMAEIVKSSAMGGINSAISSIMERGFTNNTNTLDGMLNTVRSVRSEVERGLNTDNGNEELREMLSTLASRMREPLESAMNNTLVPKLEELVAVNTESANASNKIRKGLAGLNNDMLRSI